MPKLSTFLVLFSILSIQSCSAEHVKSEIPVDSETKAQSNPLDVYYTDDYKAKTMDRIEAKTERIKKSKSPVEISFVKYTRSDLYSSIHCYEEAWSDMAYSNKLAKGAYCFELALLSLRMSEPEKCMENLSKAFTDRIAKSPNMSCSDFRAIQAPVAALLSKYDLAKQDLHALLVRGFAQSRAEYLTLLAFCDYKLGKLKASSDNLEAALKLNPQFTPALNLRAGIFYKQQNFSAALQCINELMDASASKGPIDKFLFLDSSQPYWQRGLIYAHLNKPERTVADFRMAKMIEDQLEVNTKSELMATEELAKHGYLKYASDLLKKRTANLQKELEAFKQLERRYGLKSSK